MHLGQPTGPTGDKWQLSQGSSTLIGGMEVQDTLYPFELLSLLDALREGGFTGAVHLHAESGGTVLYVVDGEVRYATTSDAHLSFPAYLMTEGVYPKEQVHRWLETCTDDEITFEDLLLSRRQIDPEGLVQLKADLGRMVFANAFALTAAVHVEPAHGPPPEFGRVVLDAYSAIFQSAVETPSSDVFAEVLMTYQDRPIRRGPDFFVMLPSLKQWFPHPQMPKFLAEPTTLAAITANMSERRKEALLAEVFAMRLAGMISFQGEPARRALLRHPVRRRSRRRRRTDRPQTPADRTQTPASRTQTSGDRTQTSGDRTQTSGPTALKPRAGKDRRKGKRQGGATTRHAVPTGAASPQPATRREAAAPQRSGTQPGARMEVPLLVERTHAGAVPTAPTSRGAPESTTYDEAFELAIEATANAFDAPPDMGPEEAIDSYETFNDGMGPGGTKASYIPRAPAPQEPDVPVAIEAESFADLRGSLVGQGLIEAEERAREQDLYSFLAVDPTAPLSDIRGAHMKAARRYSSENYKGFMLPGAAGVALRALQARTEEAYETLIDLRRRREHDLDHEVEGALNQPELEDLFYAEGVFKAAQIRMAKGSNADAIALLEDAISKNSREPEYRSYLAWALFGTGLAGEKASSRLGGPDELIETALQMRPKLESAWLFRARIADHRGDGSTALSAYYAVLNANPENDEARLTIHAYREAGIEPARQERPSLADRIAQMIRR